MRRDDVLRVLAAHKTELQDYGVRTLALFGSVARDEGGPDSDVDVLVEFQGPATFDRYMGLKLFLEDLLGRPVDLATPKALSPRLKSGVEEDLLRVP